MSNTENTPSTSFETQTCSRCGGSGSYSYCQMYGSRCFKCGGAGKVYTKRGRIAYNLYMESLKVPAGSLKIDDLLYCENVFANKAHFSKIVSIEPNGVTDPQYSNCGYLSITTASNNGLQCPANYMVRKGWDAESKAAFRSFALAYQDTLTKTGTVRKGA